MSCPSDKLKYKLGPHHEQLGKLGFLSAVDFEGRGRDVKLVYRRS